MKLKKAYEKIALSMLTMICTISLITNLYSFDPDSINITIGIWITCCILVLFVIHTKCLVKLKIASETADPLHASISKDWLTYILLIICSGSTTSLIVNACHKDTNMRFIFITVVCISIIIHTVIMYMRKKSK